jgi:starch-binding outer membrane protein SusE/F
MKNRLPISLFSLTLFFCWSCKKQENKIYFEGGTAPILTASSTAPMVLAGDNKNNVAIKFSWTNPDYRLSTGISSQDVVYTLQIDTAGANFGSSVKQEAVMSKDLSVTYTVKELNTFLTKMNLVENVPRNIEFRLKSALANNTVPLFSNVIKILIRPYLDVAVPLPPTDKLYITGNGVPSDWTNNPPASQEATPVPGSYSSTGHPTAYTIVMNFVPGKQYKFLSTLGQWQPQYGGSSDTGGELGFNMGLPGQTDPPAIPTPGVAGTYKITVNFKTGQYTVVKQ